MLHRIITRLDLFKFESKQSNSIESNHFSYLKLFQTDYRETQQRQTEGWRKLNRYDCGSGKEKKCCFLNENDKITQQLVPFGEKTEQRDSGWYCFLSLPLQNYINMFVVIFNVIYVCMYFFSCMFDDILWLILERVYIVQQ